MSIVVERISVALPALLLIGLSFIVWVLMYVERLGEMRRERIRPQQVASRGQSRLVLKQTRAADNFHNLLEMPVLFYTLTALVLMLGLPAEPFAALAMAYVGLRVLHSAIHITYNRVIHRFAVYVASSLVLLAMWIVVLRQLWLAWSEAHV